MITLNVARELFDRALKAEIGISVKVDDPKAFSQELWLCRSKIDERKYDAITLSLPAGDEYVFICKKGVDLD